MNASDFMQALANGGQDDAPKQSPDMQARRLVDSFKDLQTRHSFSPGDLVEKKPGISGSIRYPAFGDPAIVTEIISPPVFDDNQGVCSPIFRLPLDMRVMVIASDGETAEFVVSSRSFQPYSGEVA